MRGDSLGACRILTRRDIHFPRSERRCRCIHKWMWDTFTTNLCRSSWWRVLTFVVLNIGTLAGGIGELEARELTPPPPSAPASAARRRPVSGRPCCAGLACVGHEPFPLNCGLLASRERACWRKLDRRDHLLRRTHRVGPLMRVTFQYAEAPATMRAQVAGKISGFLWAWARLEPLYRVRSL